MSGANKEVVEVHVQSESEDKGRGIVQCSATVCTSELCVPLDNVTATSALIGASASKSIAAVLTRVLQYRVDKGESVLTAQAETSGALHLDDVVKEIKAKDAEFQL
jgi:hypothetical protein